MKFICVKNKEEQMLIQKHEFPGTQEVMKNWAYVVLTSAELPIPKSPLDTWYVQGDNGELIELEQKSDHLTKWNRPAGNLGSYLKKGAEFSIEYDAIRLLEEIELLEEYIDKESAKGAAHHAITATAIYYEALIGMNYSDQTIVSHKQKLGTRKPRSKQMPKLDEWLNKQDLSKRADDLWRKLKQENGPWDGLYIERDSLFEEKEKGREDSIKYKSFANRITDAKKNTS